MSVTTIQSLFQYAIASLGQAFSPPVSIQNNSDLVVTATDPATFVDTVLVLNVDYFVTGTFVGGVLTAPTVTLEAVGLHYAVGGQLTIQRQPPPSQPTTYVDGTKYLAATTNNALDWLCYSIQALNDIAARCLQVPATSAPQDAFPLATRKGQLVGFDPTGNATTFPLSSAVFAAGVPVQVASMAALRAIPVTALTTGFQLPLSGFYQPGDGGDGLFTYSSTSTATDDGGSVIAPSVGSGRWLRAMSGIISVKWFGAKGDGSTDDSAAMNAASTALTALGGGTLRLPAGTYICHANQFLISSSNIKVQGDGMGATTIKVTAQLDGIRVAKGYTTPTAIISDIEICHLSINGNVGAFSSPDDTAGNGINLNGCQNYFVHHCHIYAASQQGIAGTFFPTSGGGQTQSQASVCDCIVDCASAVTNIGIGFEGFFQRCIASRNRVAFSTAPGAGIYFGNPSGTGADNAGIVCSDNILVSANSTSGYGIQLEQQWRNATITGNTVDGFQSGIRADNGASGGSAYGATITGNHIRAFTAYGIIASPDNGVVRQTIISSNVIYSVSTTVTAGVLASTGVNVIGNFITLTAGTATGVLAFDGSIITGNYINSTSYPVDISGASSGTSTVAGNYMNAGVNGQFNGYVYGNLPIAAFGSTRIYNRTLEVGGIRITFSNAAPGSGTWVRGDIVINNAPTATSVWAWQCSVAGTPGTWVAMAGNGLAQSVTQAASTASTVAGVVTDLNTLLTNLKNAGLMAS